MLQPRLESPGVEWEERPAAHEEGDFPPLRELPLPVREQLEALGFDRTLSRLVESERRFRDFFEQAPVACQELDREGIVRRVNQAQCRLLGIEADAILGRPVFEFVSPPEQPQGRETWRRRLSGEKTTAPFLCECVRRDGRRLTLEVHCALIRDQSGAATGMRSVLLDVTERKRVEEALLRRTEELARSNTELEQFAHVASHDFQEPLRMVSSYTQLLARRYHGKLDADADEFIAFAVDGATRMQRLIDDLLAYSRIATNGREFKPVDAGAALKQALVNLNSAIEDSETSVTFDPLPTVVADSRQLTQLFQNLVENAIKFCRTEPPRVHVSAEQRAKEWEFFVRDSGSGIEPRQLERIFVVFQRLRTAAEFPGMGIGLAICMKIVERHGGRLWVTSEPGAGSVFHFTIPLQDS